MQMWTSTMWHHKISLLSRLLHFLLLFMTLKEAISKKITIPHDIYPGYYVTNVNSVAQSLRLLENEFTDYFTLLDGHIITTQNLFDLENSLAKLFVIENFTNETKVKAYELHIINRKGILKFPKRNYIGKVLENQPPGSLVQGLQKITASKDPLQCVIYRFVSGNDNNLFDIIHSNETEDFEVLTNLVLDRELQPVYNLILQASTSKGDSTKASLQIIVEDENDNFPIPEKKLWVFRIPENATKYSKVGAVIAHDADGDRPVYHFAAYHPLFIMVPKSGEIILTGQPQVQVYNLTVQTHDNRTPYFTSIFNVSIVVFPLLDKMSNVKGSNNVLIRRKRDIRPTMTYEFKESSGNIVGKVLLQLEKNRDETFKLLNQSQWIEIDLNGDVKVKKPWDYEELEREKTIDFWVEVGTPNTKVLDEQRIIIHVQDVNDENPYFINRPLPMQAIVERNPPSRKSVYKLQARDPDTDSDIHYSLVRDRTGGLFDVDEKSGEVRAVGSGSFLLDKEYVLYVKAEDRNGVQSNGQYQSTEEERLSIIGERRPPQFYMHSYSATVPENRKKESDIIEVKALSFSGKEIRYSLQAQGKGAGTFSIGPTNGIVKLTKALDYEDLRQPKFYSLIVTATEDFGGFSTSVELSIEVVDVNDNPPRFEVPDYQKPSVGEDVPVGTSILQVSATDLDQGKNAELEYSLESDNFTIDSRGIIYSNKRLDADLIEKYILTVRATDKGDPPLTGTATVRIYTENRNDEAPKFSQDVYTPSVDETAGPSTLVTTVVASDIDGDNIIFGFMGGGTVSGMFQIDERTGVIRLINGPIQLDKDKYELNVTAQDDGACCKNGALSTHTSTALVVVFITDVNDNKPVFENCSNYAPRIEEGADSGTFVIQVTASDQDKGYNGQVRYSIVQQPNQRETKFRVDEVTGKVATNKVFDREGDDGRFVSITLKATDRGNPPLEGVCSFKVEITDINDNPPLFHRSEYQENVKQDAPIGSNILRVAASDEDADNNGAITYSLSSYNTLDLEYFTINHDSGWIRLNKALDKGQYRLQAIAKDKGINSLTATVNVLIDVVDRKNNPPVWDSAYEPVRIKENISLSDKVISIRARSGIPDNPTVYYSIIKGGTEQTNKRDTFFLTQYLSKGDTWADIMVNYALDFERIQQYNITVRVENDGAQQLASETTVVILLEDVNDEIPLFIEQEKETVLEGMPPGTKVTQVQAIDKDLTHPFNKVSYSIQPGDDGDKFEINMATGEIFTLKVFDREERQSYVVIVKAEDGAPSARPNAKPGQPNFVTKYIRIGIGDKNDNPPYFDQALYEAEVNEDEDTQHIVITVTARDKDESSRIRYEITQGNIGGAFAVKNETGVIYVASSLDYETRKEYNLTLVASDTLYENYTTVYIRVKDINDLPPKFGKPSYEASILEEDSEGLPKKILKVTAIDGDLDRNSEIVYFLTGQGIESSIANSKFSINSTTGDIYVLKPLDRDLPHGRSQWRFIVYATDEGGDGLVEYADVLVNLVDINDNAPFFPQAVYTGNVTENGTEGMTVMTMTATDYDDPNKGTNAILTYTIEQNQVNEKGELIFAIDGETGVIKTAVCCLDRETNPEYIIRVVATDGGGLKGTGTATIKIRDINDMPPEFTKKEWYVQVEETEDDNLPETPILVVSVSDGDLLETNRFNYKVVDRVFGADKFTMVTNSDGTGSLKIAKPLNYEDPQQRFGFNITIQVSDHGGESPNVYHVDYAKVYIGLIDINDNPPEFRKSTITVEVKENEAVGKSIAKFEATDPDQGGKSKVSFSIDYASNRMRQFRINQTGTVFIQRPLDREMQERHEVKILATDDGTPPRTATATLVVVVLDINDNAPHFRSDYRPVVMENEPPPQKVIELFADDPDVQSNDPNDWPLFKFMMDPNAGDNIKESFNVTQNPGGDEGKGSAFVYSLTEFDREKQKEYHVPILIADSGEPSLTSTNTLTVIIGDVNDNKMKPGRKNIFVYTFKGDSQPSIPVPIGRVHVQDLDDWDLPDKVFYWKQHSSHPNFDLDENTGEIFMKKLVSGGKYTLEFQVYDQRFSNQVDAVVTVEVKEIPEEAVYNSGSVRLTGITPEDFIREWDWKNEKKIKSKYEKFKDVVAQLLGVNRNNVDIFTVICDNYTGLCPPVTDVRFSAHGSPYYKATKLNGILELNRKMIEDKVGINITMIGIDECLHEYVKCESSCTNDLKVHGDKPFKVNANLTSFVGIWAVVEPRCTCGARDFSEVETCKKNPCYNDGFCSDKSGVITCTCHNGFEGPRCQQTTRSFNGNGWAWFPPLQQCEDSHFSIQFITEKADGLILYNGPISNPDSGEIAIEDFISLELENGKPKLLIDFGSGTAQVTVNVVQDLNDGEWHQVDIFWTREKVWLVVDRCISAITNDDPLLINRSMCEAYAHIPPFNEFLNVNGPLQLGGVKHKRLSAYNWKYQHTFEGFDGCIRSVIHNSEMYDLGSPGTSSNSTPGCPRLDKFCRINSQRMCKHGTCVANYNRFTECDCYPGYQGTYCTEETQTKMFLENSYIKYALTFDPNPYKTEIQVSFRTRQKHGELFRAMSKQGSEYCVLEVRNRTLRFRYNLNNRRSSEHELWLPYVQVSDGIWHTVKVQRYGSTASIALDGGGGRHYNEILNYDGLHQKLDIERQNVFAGGEVQFDGIVQDTTDRTQHRVVVDNDFKEGCINDIRLDRKHLPMGNGSQTAFVLEARNIIDGCPSNNPCNGIYCSPPFVCIDLWMLHKCMCPKGFILTEDGQNCTDENECISNPCLNGGTCENLDNGNGFLCICPTGFIGEFCNAVRQEKVMQLSAAALALIVVCLFGILIVVLIIVAYTRIRAQRPYDQKDIIDDVRENIVIYDDEGGGEDDMNAYDIKTLRIPIDGGGTPLGSKPGPEKPPLHEPLHWQAPPGTQPDVGDFIRDHLDKADNDPSVPPFDDLRNYAYEGGGSTAGSLSSLASGTDDNDQDFDYLNGWGPRFQKLADMYGQGESEED